MNLTLIQSLMMGLVSGLAELLPVSSQAHRGFLRLCFGVEQEGGLFLLLCHVATLAVVAFCLRSELARLRRASRLMKGSARRRHQQPDHDSACTVRHLRSAMVVMVATRLLFMRLSFVADRLYLLCGTLFLCGLLLWLPGVTRGGNKDGRNMLRIDSLLMGLAAGCAAIPGISLVGAAASVGALRGIDRSYALRFALLLLMPSLGVDIALDVLALAAAGAVPGMAAILTVLAGAAVCALGSWFGLRVMQAMARSSGFSGWSYYLWGMSLVCFILFLTL